MAEPTPPMLLRSLLAPLSHSAQNAPTTTGAPTQSRNTRQTQKSDDRERVQAIIDAYSHFGQSIDGMRDVDVMRIMKEKGDAEVSREIVRAVLRDNAKQCDAEKSKPTLRGAVKGAGRVHVLQRQSGDAELCDTTTTPFTPPSGPLPELLDASNHPQAGMDVDNTPQVVTAAVGGTINSNSPAQPLPSSHTTAVGTHSPSTPILVSSTPSGSLDKVLSAVEDAPKALPTEEPSLITPSPVEVNYTADASLTSLLDFEPLLSSSQSNPRLFQDAISSRFSSIARSLLASHRIALSNPNTNQTLQYDILELEFYLRLKHEDDKDKSHVDPFIHGADEQRVSGKWYFHRAPGKNGKVSTKGYRGGTRKGLDLTFGGPVSSRFFPSSSASGKGESSQDGTRGGILLRSLRRRSDGVVISGPSLLVDEILKQSGVEKIAELVEGEGMWGGRSDAFGSPPTGSVSLRICRNTGSEAQNLANPGQDGDREKAIYRSPRVGLDLTNRDVKLSRRDPRINFIGRPYRYFRRPDLLSESGKGRGQTFYGVYHYVLNSVSSGGENDPYDSDDMQGLSSRERLRFSDGIAKAMGLSPHTTTSYIVAYEGTKEKNDDLAWRDGLGALEELAQYTSGKNKYGRKGRSPTSPPQWLSMMRCVEKAVEGSHRYDHDGYSSDMLGSDGRYDSDRICDSDDSI